MSGAALPELALHGVALLALLCGAIGLGLSGGACAPCPPCRGFRLGAALLLTVMAAYAALNFWAALAGALIGAALTRLG